jgi:hypothetical protein
VGALFDMTYFKLQTKHFEAIILTNIIVELRIISWRFFLRRSLLCQEFASPKWTIDNMNQSPLAE